MGEENEDFTDEEKQILGEKDEEEEVSEKEEKEEAEEKEEVEGEKEEEKEKGPVPYERFKEKLDRAKEADALETKLDLLRSDPEEYYNQYPDEKPEEKRPLKEEAAQEDEIWNRIIQGGPYDGRTLGDVYDEGGEAARYALNLYNQERDNVRAEQTATADRREKSKQEANAELDSFGTQLSQDIFEKKPDDLSEDETAQINGIIDETLDWMEKTGRGFGSIVDGYLIKNKDKILAGEQIKGVSNVIKSTQDNVIHIANKKDVGTKLTGYEADMGKTADELAAKVDNMTDDQATKYFANAPEKLKQRFPSVDWG
jgi:hypothetical protein